MKTVIWDTLHRDALLFSCAVSHTGSPGALVVLESWHQMLEVTKNPAQETFSVENLYFEKNRDFIFLKIRKVFNKAVRPGGG